MDRTDGKLPGLVLSQENACNITPKETPGGTPHMKGVGMLVGNFELNPQKETDLGGAQAFFDPLKETMLKHRQYIYFHTFSRATLNETFTAKYDGVLPRTP